MALQRIAAAQVPALLDSLAQQGQRAVVIDVREPQELAVAAVTLSNADLVAMPMRSVPARHLELDRQRPVLTLCHHGARSMQVAMYLTQLGYPMVYNIEGGIDAWSVDVDPSVARY